MKEATSNWNHECSRRYIYIRYGELWGFSCWTSRRRPATAGNSYYFIRLINESAFVDAHQWTGTGINRKAGEENEKRWQKRERERGMLFSKFKISETACSSLATSTHSDVLKDSQKYPVMLSIGSTFRLQIVSSKSKSYRYSDAHKINFLYSSNKWPVLYTVIAFIRSYNLQLMINLLLFLSLNAPKLY